MTYGAITRIDAGLLESVLAEFKGKGHLKFLEIGVWHGETAIGINEFCKQHDIELDYWGIDTALPPVPSSSSNRQNLHFVHGLSEEVWDQVPDNFDVVFVDGCHCINHVILDAIHYSHRVVPGGFMVFHDTAPQFQHVMTNRWVHGDENKPIHLTAVVDALKLLGWPNPEWKLWSEGYDPASDIGGMQIYRKLL